MSYSSRGEKYVYHVDQRGQSYDNKAYAENPPPSSRHSSHSRSSGSRYPEENYYHEPDRSRQEAKSKRCYVIVAVVAVVLLIAAAIAVGVYFGVTGDDKDKEPEGATVRMEFELDEDWIDEYDNPDSPEYKAKAAEIENQVDELYIDIDAYKDSQVVALSEGSIIAALAAKFKSTEVKDNDGNTYDMKDATKREEFIQKQIKKKKDAGKPPFADKLISVKSEKPQDGQVGDKDLGEACSTVNDCQDKDVTCPGDTKKCTCKLGYYNKNTQSAKGFCVAGLAYGANTACTMNRQCAYEGGECSNAKCDCSSEYFGDNNRCKTKIDIDRLGCSEDTHCRYSGATCDRNNMCKCVGETFKAMSAKRCAPQIGIGDRGCSGNDADDQCRGGSMCVSGVCKCPPGQVEDDGTCKQKTDDDKVCTKDHMFRYFKEDCSQAFNKYLETGDARHLLMSLGCLKFHAVVRGEDCDLSEVLDNLKDSEWKSRRTPMEISTCINTFKPEVDMDAEIRLTTSKKSDYVTVQLYIPQAMVIDPSLNVFVGFGLSNDDQMSNSLIYTIEQFKGEHTLNIRSAPGYKVKPEIVEGNANNTIRNLQFTMSGKHIIMTFKEEKDKEVIPGFSFTGSRHLLFAYGNLDASSGDLTFHSQKDASNNAFPLDCDKTVQMKLADFTTGMTKTEMCTHKWSTRYLLEYQCEMPFHTTGLTDAEKCVLRTAGKYCVLRHLKEAGIDQCTADDVEKSMKDPEVMWKLFEGYPDGSCEADLGLNRCEQLWVASSQELFDCSSSLSTAVLWKNLMPGFATAMDPSNSRKLTCTLLRGSFLCSSSFFEANDCKPADIMRVTGMALKLLQRFVIQESLRNPILQAVIGAADLTEVDFTTDCSVDDLDPKPGQCPTTNQLASVIVARCGINVLFIPQEADRCTAGNILPCAKETVVAIFKSSGCLNDPEEAIEETIQQYNGWLTSMLGFDLDDCRNVQGCLEVMTENSDCSVLFGLFDIEARQGFLNAEEICVVGKQVEEEFLTECFQRHNRAECVPHAGKVWKAAVKAYRWYKGGEWESKFEQCDGVTVDHCEYQDITTVFSCWNLYNHGKGPCSINHCLRGATHEEGCQGKVTVDFGAVKDRSEDIYGSYPECNFGECGADAFNHFKASCYHSWSKWETATKENKPDDACKFHEDFLLCAAVTMVVEGGDKCPNMQTLQNNLKTNAQEEGEAFGDICQGDSYETLNAMVPEKKTGLCKNVAFYRYMLKYVCGTDSYLEIFADNAGNACPRELQAKVCMYGYLEAFDIKCDDDEVWNFMSSNVASELFPESGCESQYPCVLKTLDYADKLNDCAAGASSFLALSSQGVNVDTQLAIGSQSTLLKCEVWNLFSSCVYGVLLMHSDVGCLANMPQVQTGLKMLVHARYPDAVNKTSIFDECPAYVAKTTACPENNELLVNVISSCGPTAITLKQIGLKASDVCGAVDKCMEEIKKAWFACPEIEEIFRTQKTNLQNVQYMDGILGTSCTKYYKAGMCPEVDENTVGTCAQECGGDTSCSGEEKCCSTGPNGCGLKCMTPLFGWRKCGDGVFPTALQSCGGHESTKLWLDQTKSETDRCESYRSFFGCVASHILSSGLDTCGVDTLHDNIQAGAISAGEITTKLNCNNLPDLGTNRKGLCTNPLAYNLMMRDYCPPTVLHSSTEDASKDACLSEIQQVVCVGTILGGLPPTAAGERLECSAEDITKTKNLPAARDQLFNGNPPNCEDDKQCLFQYATLTRDYSDKMYICSSWINDFLYLTSGVPSLNADTQTAFNPADGKLKCQILNIAIGCAWVNSAEIIENSDEHETCADTAAKREDYKNGLLWFADMGSGLNVAAIQKVGIFSECAVLNPSQDGDCPMDDQLLASTLASCSLRAVHGYAQSQDMSSTCENLLACAQGNFDWMKQHYTKCTTIDSYWQNLFTQEKRDYLKTVTGLECPDPFANMPSKK